MRSFTISFFFNNNSVFVFWEHYSKIYIEKIIDSRCDNQQELIQVVFFDKYSF